MSVYMIAEAGASHGGDFDTAVKLAGAASRAGADCVKFQVWQTEKFVASSSPQFQTFRKMELTQEEWTKLKSLCDASGFDFLASAWDMESVDFLDSIGMKAFKIGSGDITHGPIVKHIGSKGKPVYLSTGMATKGEIDTALKWLSNVPVTLLKCTVDYPCAEQNVNLSGMELLKMFCKQVGFSDHTKGYIAGAMAVAAGASVIEKHFALRDEPEAIGADMLKGYVETIRLAESIMGSPELRMFACEKKWKSIARRGESGLRE